VKALDTLEASNCVKLMGKSQRVMSVKLISLDQCAREY
jgi:hypothetical protein